ncbi:hypothetical protein V5799_010314, partial [Amblyomma americanum]
MKLHKADYRSLDLNRMRTFCENLNALPSRPAVAKKTVPESAAVGAQKSEISALKDKLESPSCKKIFSYCCDKCPAMFKSHYDLDTHKAYHNSGHLYPCHHCDYRARHKAHLRKHLLVHTPEYAERQNGFTLAEIRSQQPESATPPAAPAAADQMLLLEKAETRAFVDAGSQSMGVQLHHCIRCPAAFQKPTTLEYHLSLHGSTGVYTCHFCNYAANSAANPMHHYKPQAYMKCDSLEIWSTASDGTRTLVFRDLGDEKYFPELDASEDDTLSSPASTPASSGSCSASMAFRTPQLQLDNKDLRPAVLKPVKHETDDVVLASKETLEELVSNVVLNDKKEEMPPGCKTQVVNIAVLDGTKQLNEVGGEVAQAEHKSESETDFKDDVESAQDLFNRVCNPDSMEYEDLEDEKDMYCETLSEDPDVADEVECKNVEEDSIKSEALAADPDPMLKAHNKHAEHTEFLDITEASDCELSAECKDMFLHSVECESEHMTADVPDGVATSSLVTDKSFTAAIETGVTSESNTSCRVKKFEESEPV